MTSTWEQKDWDETLGADLRQKCFVVSQKKSLSITAIAKPWQADNIKIVIDLFHCIFEKIYFPHVTSAGSQLC